MPRRPGSPPHAVLPAGSCFPPGRASRRVVLPAGASYAERPEESGQPHAPPPREGNQTRGRRHGGSREYHPRRRRGVEEKEFQELLAVCLICRRPDPEHLDHDHRTGWVRGILCFNCTGGPGRSGGRPDRPARAITYLRGTTWQRVLIHPGVFQMCSPTRGRPPSPLS
ncbi:endonuclease domain-containing protein [Micromonospora sp. DT31]|uniref:endonuclease domain-containing protein n=1 Tax=Micromonospora sp. DT31 TaxID=3393434 RepID=UPI003CF95242